MAINFCNTIQDAGYKAGVYANLNWFNNYLNVSQLLPYYIWLAQWTNSHTANFRVDFWQYTSKGQILGINGNVDLNYDLRYNEDHIIKKSNEEIAQEVIQGQWDNGQKRKDLLLQAGYDPIVIQNIVNKMYGQKKSNKEIAKEIIKGKGNWGIGEIRKKRLREAGYDPSEVQKIVNKLMKK